MIGHCIESRNGIGFPTLQYSENVRRLVLFNVATEKTLLAGTLADVYRSFSQEPAAREAFVEGIEANGLPREQTDAGFESQLGETRAGDDPEFAAYLYQLYNKKGQMRTLYNNLSQFGTFRVLDEFHKPAKFPPVCLFWGGSSTDPRCLARRTGDEVRARLQPDRCEFLEELRLASDDEGASRRDQRGEGRRLSVGDCSGDGAGSMTGYYMLRSYDRAGYYETSLVIIFVALAIAFYFLRRKHDSRFLIMFISGVCFQAIMEYILQTGGARGAGYHFSMFGLSLSGIGANLFQGISQGGIFSLMAFWFVDLKTGGDNPQSRKVFLAVYGLIVAQGCVVGLLAAGQPITSPRPMFTPVTGIWLAATVIPAVLLAAWKRGLRYLGYFYIGLFLYCVLALGTLQVFGARYIGQRSPSGALVAAPLAMQAVMMLYSFVFEVAGEKLHYLAVPFAMLLTDPVSGSRGQVSFWRITTPAPQAPTIRASARSSQVPGEQRSSAGHWNRNHGAQAVRAFGHPVPTGVSH